MTNTSMNLRSWIEQPFNRARLGPVSFSSTPSSSLTWSATPASCSCRCSSPNAIGPGDRVACTAAAAGPCWWCVS